MKKICYMIIAVILISCMAVFSVSATDELTLQRAVALDDTTIILEFSQPIAVNKNGNTAGPYCAIRYVTGDNTELFWDGDKPLQFDGTLIGAGEQAPNKLIWTLNPVNAFNATTVAQIINKEGDLAKYTEPAVMFCIEEIPLDAANLKADQSVENITDLEGTVALKATMTAANDSIWEGAYISIETDPEYQLYETAVQESQPAEEPEESATESAPEAPETTETEKPEEEATIGLGNGVVSGRNTVSIWVVIVLATVEVLLIAAVIYLYLQVKKLKQNGENK